MAFRPSVIAVRSVCGWRALFCCARCERGMRLICVCVDKRNTYTIPTGAAKAAGAAAANSMDT
jgi:hypothetical protein